MTEPLQPALFTLTRRGDPDTSHAAAASLGDLRQSQAAVLQLLAGLPDATDDELADAARRAGLQISPSGLRTRRHELVALGLAHDTGQRRPLPSGRMAVVWAAD